MGVLAAVDEAGVEVGGVASCEGRGVLPTAGGAEGACAGMFDGICEGTGVVPVDAGVSGAGVEDRVWAGEGVGSVVRRHRSLSVSFGALAAGTAGGDRPGTAGSWTGRHLIHQMSFRCLQVWNQSRKGVTVSAVSVSAKLDRRVRHLRLD